MVSDANGHTQGWFEGDGDWETLPVSSVGTTPFKSPAAIYYTLDYGQVVTQLPFRSSKRSVVDDALLNEWFGKLIHMQHDGTTWA